MSNLVGIHISYASIIFFLSDLAAGGNIVDTTIAQDIALLEHSDVDISPCIRITLSSTYSDDMQSQITKFEQSSQRLR
jgi:hypothetical protein